MRISRLKFTEIQDIVLYIELLNNERDINSELYSNVAKKIVDKEYAEASDCMFATTLEDLKLNLKITLLEQEQINRILADENFKLKLLKKSKSKLMSLYRVQAISIIYKSNKTEIKNLQIGTELLGSRIYEIRFNIDQIKDRIDFVVSLENGTAITKYVSIDNIVSMAIEEQGMV